MTIKSIFILGLLNVCFGITVQATPVNFVAIPYSDINSLAKQLKTSRYSPFENPTGLYFEEGETIQVTAPDLQGYQLNLLLVDFSKPAEGEKKEKTTVFTLKTGNNKFYAPHKGLVYVSYYVKDCRKAPEQKLTFHTGINNGVFNAYQHTNDEWKRMLDSAIAEVIDMQGKYVHLTFDVKTLREKGSDCGVEMIRMYDRIILWQQEMLGIDQFGYRTNNHMFARISWAGPPNANGKGVSFPRTSSIIRPEDIRNSNWVIGHEFGHVNQVRPGLKWHGTTEITNNIQAAWIQYLLRPIPTSIMLATTNGTNSSKLASNILNNGARIVTQRCSFKYPSNRFIDSYSFFYLTIFFSIHHFIFYLNIVPDILRKQKSTA